jgi:hypothetical protein
VRGRSRSSCRSRAQLAMHKPTMVTVSCMLSKIPLFRDLHSSDWNGSDVGVEAVPDAGYDAADEELWQGGGGAEEGCVNYHEAAAGRDHLLAAEMLAEEDVEETACGAADVVGGGEYALDVGGADDAGHDALVVPEEEALATGSWIDVRCLILKIDSCNGPIQPSTSHARSTSKESHVTAVKKTPSYRQIGLYYLISCTA